jgi:hypothetical protein
MKPVMLFHAVIMRKFFVDQSIAKDADKLAIARVPESFGVSNYPVFTGTVHIKFEKRPRQLPL